MTAVSPTQAPVKTAISKDGTVIAYDQVGSGAPLVLVTGALGSRQHAMMAGLVEMLAQHFTVFNYDRRGRGDSGDTPPYAVLREVEDIEAVIDAAGGAAYLYGISSGAALALEAANKLPNKVKKLTLYEPPFVVDDSHAPLPEDYVPHLQQLTAEGRRSDALEYFMTAAIQLPPEYLAGMKADPSWAELEKTAHTLSYDGMVVRDNMRGKPLRPGQWTNVTMPTLVMTGGSSEPFFYSGAQALIKELKDARHRVLDGQTHAVEAAALVPALVEFLK